MEGTTRSVGQPMIVSNGATLGGSGLVIATIVSDLSGMVSPGNSPGELTLDAQYRQGPAGQLLIELNGYQPGIDSDLLTVLDTADLDGIIDFQMFGDFLPQAGDEFLFLQAGDIEGQFDQLFLPHGIKGEILYTPTTATFRVTESIPEPNTALLATLALLSLVLRHPYRIHP